MQTSIAEPPAPAQCEQVADDQAKSWSFAIGKGDAKAFGEFYEAWFDRCVEVVQSMTQRDEAFALDVVQDVMMKAAKSIPVLYTHAELERWMFRVMYTTSIDHLRRSLRRVRRESQALREEISVSSDDDAISHLEDALAQLGPAERDLLLMRFARGFTLKSLGDMLNTTPDAAHGRIRRILDSLRNLMKGTQL